METKRREKTSIDHEEDEEDMEDQDGNTETILDDKKKKTSGKRGPGTGGSSSSPRCQADKCGADLTDAKRYHRRHKVCEFHAKAAVVIIAALPQRFCQQCSRFHELSEFDETKRSCRRRLAGHNERRRKSSSGDSFGYGEGSSSRKGFGQITLPAAANATYKQFQFR